MKALSAARVNDDVIISQIRSTGTSFHLSSADIIDLSNSGVSQRVIEFMINTQGNASSAAPQPVTVAQAPPVDPWLARMPAAAFRTEVPAQTDNVILGRPTDRSVTLSVLAYADREGFIRHGPAPDQLTRETSRRLFRGGEPAEILLDAIGRSDGGRASVIDEVYKTNVQDGIMGSFGLDANGDTTAGGVTVRICPATAVLPDFSAWLRAADAREREEALAYFREAAHRAEVPEDYLARVAIACGARVGQIGRAHV